jgi:acyl transferase domain-containing protein
MEVAWAAVENAGCAPRSGLVQNTGVFAASGID